MIHFAAEIEDCLRTLRNTNNKEQNFQGILFGYFLNKYGEDYEVEMETSRDDIHVKGSLIPTYYVDGKDHYAKKEIDLLIYNKLDPTEKYAAELKWIYHRRDSGRWNCLDMIRPFGEDALFVDQLMAHAGFTETCSVVVYDFNPVTLVNRVVYGNEEQARVKRMFLGGEFEDERKRGTLIVNDLGVEKSYDFEWHRGVQNIEEGQDYKYYIIVPGKQ